MAETKNDPAKKDRLNHDDMKKVIEDGGAVLYRGNTITRVDDLPSAAELAETDEDRAAAERDLQRRQAALDLERQRLSRPQAARPTGGAGADDAGTAKKK